MVGTLLRSRENVHDPVENTYRIDGLYIFNEENDGDPTCVRLRTQFSQHMFRLTGKFYPEPDEAINVHKEWLLHVHTMLIRRRPQTVHNLKHGISHALQMRGIGMDADSENPLYCVFGDTRTLPEDFDRKYFFRNDHFVLEDCFAEPETRKRSGSVGFASKAEDEIGPAGYRPVIMTISTQAIMNALSRGSNLYLAIDEIARDVMAHEFLHVGAQHEAVLLENGRIGFRTGLMMRYEDDDEEVLNLWGNEALIEYTCLCAFPDRNVTYTDSTFVFALIDQLEPNFFLEALVDAYVRTDGEAATHAFDDRARRCLKKILGNDRSVNELIDYLNDASDTERMLGRVTDHKRRLSVMGNLLKKCVDDPEFKDAAGRANVKLNFAFSSLLADSFQTLAGEGKIKLISSAMQKIRDNISPDRRAIHSAFPFINKRSTEELVNRKLWRWRIAAVFGVGFGVGAFGVSVHDAENVDELCRQFDAQNQYGAIIVQGDAESQLLEGLSDEIGPVILPDGRVVQVIPLPDSGSVIIPPRANVPGARQLHERVLERDQPTLCR